MFDSIATALGIILTSIAPKVIQPIENDNGNSVSSKSDKSHIAKIDDQVVLQHLYGSYSKK